LAAAEVIGRDSSGKRSGIIMDSADQRPREDDATFFRRLEIDHRVDAYFVFLPARAKVLGTVFEGGMLIRDFQFGRNPRIVLFVEAHLLAPDWRGGFEFVAKGKRTRYLRSLIARTHSVIRWTEADELLSSVVALAGADP
jgi:hypothetical protein